MTRNSLEKAVSKKLHDYQYEPFTLDYTVAKTYLPDFVNDKKKILVEVKGFFRTHAEANKYLCVRECNPEWEIVFVFADGNKPMPGARKRKDGTKYSMGEWATVNGFRWSNVNNIKDLRL